MRSTIMNHIKKSLWMFYLGGALAWAGITLDMKEFYIILIPVCCLVFWGRPKKAVPYRSRSKPAKTF